MICPACNGSLSEATLEEIQLDVCKEGCGGVWFDRFELEKMDEPHEFTDENLLDVLGQESKADPDQSKRHFCPKCSDVVMMRHFFSVKKEVEVDHCPKCAGYWLDDGELFHIRDQFKTEEDRKEAAMKHFSSLFEEDLAKMRKESSEKSGRVRNIANMFRLVTPSYYFSKLKNW